MEQYKKIIILVILILILCIGVGIAVKVYLDLKGNIVYGTMHDMEVQAFNSKFIEYYGRRTYSDVINLMDIINENNQKYEDKDQLKVKLIIDGEEIEDLSNKEIVELNAKYEIEMQFDNNNELINQINVNKIK